MKVKYQSFRKTGFWIFSYHKHLVKLDISKSDSVDYVFSSNDFNSPKFHLEIPKLFSEIEVYYRSLNRIRLNQFIKY